MIEKASDSEIKLAESIANEIRDRIQTHYMESGISSGYEKAEVLVPMTENINMPFEIDVPYEMTDEDNTALLEYFIQHIYKPENGSYMTEAVNTLIAEKEIDIQRLQENLDNFDAEAFMQGDYDPFNENDNPIVKLPNMAQEKYTVVKLGDILDTPIDGEYLTEMPKVVEDVVPYGNFMKQWKKMTKGDVEAVHDYLMENPELNNMPIKGDQYKEASGIARKLRWNLKTNTASRTGDARIINAYISNLNQIFLLLCYPKSAQEDPSSVQIKSIIKTIRFLREGK